MHRKLHHPTTEDVEALGNPLGSLHRLGSPLFQRLGLRADPAELGVERGFEGRQTRMGGPDLDDHGPLPLPLPQVGNPPSL